MIARKKALSVLFYTLAAVGVMLLLCFLVACFMLAQKLFGQSAAGTPPISVPELTILLIDPLL
jgi:hypothetical protein